MKKLLFVCIAVFGFATAHAQDGFNVGISGGLPIGDAGDGWTFSILLDANYLWETSNQFDLGLATGYSHSFGDTIAGFDIDDAGFIPLAGAARFNASEEFAIGLDIGYAIGVAPSGNDGGFYYAPRVQYSVSDTIDIVGAYRGVSIDGGSFDIISLGVEFGVN